jgi:hypothetical protein
MHDARAHRIRAIATAFALIVIAAILLLWQQVDASGCAQERLLVDACDELVDVEQARPAPAR